MKILIFRVAFLLLLVFLQLSFFNILFPWFRAPLFLLGTIAAFTLVRPFPGVLSMTIPLTILYDAATLSTVTWFSFYAVFFSYVTSFLLRRLLLEHRAFGLSLYALMAFGAALLYQALCTLFAFQDSLPDAGRALFQRAAPSTESLIFALIVFVPLFFITYFTVKRFETYLELQSERQFRNIR